MKTFNEIELTDQQFTGLSWLAYYNRNMLSIRETDRNLNDKNNRDYFYQMYGGYNAMRTMCETVLNVPYQAVYDVSINNYCKGLKNMNRISDPQVLEY